MKKLLYPLAAFCLFLTSCYETEDAPDITSEYFTYGLNNLSGYQYFNPDDQFGERYNDFEENPFVNVLEAPVSTFSIDADGASYSNVRRFLNNATKPPKGAIRTEELINYFPYNYAEPTGVHPVAVNGEIAQCPWNPVHQLIRIGIKGNTVEYNELPPANFVLLVDVSGSMGASDKLPLLLEGFTRFTNKMGDRDRIAIVTYAGSAGVALPSTSGKEKAKIIKALKSLQSGGSTAGAEGIATAYQIAMENFIEGGNNRVILGTDGDFNVGVSSQEELVKLIESKRDDGVYLTVLGYGQGNINEGMMEQVANNGNGNYEYIDNIAQSDKVFIHEYSKFYTVAKDVKVQIRFHPAQVESYRLIGYENRLLNEEDFEDDKKDAGEIGAGQCITALYEVKPAVNAASRIAPAFTIDFRYKNPDQEVSKVISLNVINYNVSFENASEDLRFAAAVTGYGMLLRDSEYKETLSYSDVAKWAKKSRSFDPHQYREEFLKLVETAKSAK